MTPSIIFLEHAKSADEPLIGGKAASLARLARAAVPVPNGFVVTTSAYREHLATSGGEELVRKGLGQLGAGDTAGLEQATAAIRQAIIGAPMPSGLGDSIIEAYSKLGEARFVAVRSSGTLEDLAEASFAGLHDTYLDVRGGAALLEAVRRCWASMWTARATAYRETHGYEHESASLAVLVLEMVLAEVSGVIFTANPLNRRVDEYVVNSTWGLGEALVSGITTPDEYVLSRRSLTAKTVRRGSKERQVVRAPDGRGTTTEAVPVSRRDQLTLAAEQIIDLGTAADRITRLAGGWPQDIEWAYAAGQLFVLQARDITGVDLSWDEDLEAHGVQPPLSDDAVLSRARSDAVWTGRITPLFYSLRSETRTLVTPKLYGVWAGGGGAQRRWGRPGVEIGSLRWYKYFRGAVYFNSEVEFRNHLELVPPRLRDPTLCEWTPPSWLQGFERQPGSWTHWLRIGARIQRSAPHLRITKVLDSLNAQIQKTRSTPVGLSPAELSGLSDEQLKTAVDDTLVTQARWVRDIGFAFYLYLPFMTAAFRGILGKWARGVSEDVKADLLLGLPRKSLTVVQNEWLGALAQVIRESASLREAFREHPGPGFFEAVQGTEEGRAFLSVYHDFLAEFGHRGHSDRDIWYPRRSEDPWIDYRALATLLGDEAGHQGEDERARGLVTRRIRATAEVAVAVGRGPLGPVKTALFKRVHGFMLEFYAFRDDARHMTDRNTFAKKVAVQEMGRRLIDRGVLEDGDDFYYLSKNELFALLDNEGDSPRLTRAKIDARRRNCERYRVEWDPPMYIQGSGEEHHEEDGTRGAEGTDGRTLGVAMSRGKGVGRARLVASIAELDKIQRGDVLVAHGTDPGWTPVFPLLAGLVLETGGALAHGALLSREYGIPAIQLPNALRLIQDGDLVELDGTTGELWLHPERSPNGDEIHEAV